MKEFYNYVYLDPRKSGQYSYANICFLYEPIYIGKGKDDRKYDHLKRTDQHPLITKILKIKKENFLPFIEVIFSSTDEKEVLLKEQDFIREIGRRDLSLGPLCNLTNGGDGIGGCKTIDKSGSKNSMYGKKHTKETIEKIIKSCSKASANSHNVDSYSLTIDGIFYGSLKEAERKTNIGRGILKKYVLEKGARTTEEIIKKFEENIYNRSHSYFIDGTYYKSQKIAKLKTGYTREKINAMCDDPTCLDSYKILNTIYRKNQEAVVVSSSSVKP